MANHSLRASTQYRLPGPGPRTTRQLDARFQYTPRHSMIALPAQAGPFRATEPYRDAFRFSNRGGWNMTEADAATLRARLQREVNVVKLLTIEALRGALSAVTISVPVLAPFSLPGIVVSEVIRRITDPLTDKIVETILGVSPSNYGRCGGMAFAALDYFLVGRDVVQDASQPASGPRAPTLPAGPHREVPLKQRENLHQTAPRSSLPARRREELVPPRGSSADGRCGRSHSIRRPEA